MVLISVLFLDSTRDEAVSTLLRTNAVKHTEPSVSPARPGFVCEREEGTFRREIVAFTVRFEYNENRFRALPNLALDFAFGFEFEFEFSAPLLNPFIGTRDTVGLSL